ncbi:hypothetical protein ACF08E_12625 [Streptomyces globisporus]|uniref:hypothetical protein n=1 Tax=Streptomyces globisporus TaxID=1908 RepID=UPI0036F65263
MEPREPASISHSPSTWQQPHPAPSSAERGALTEAVAERIRDPGAGPAARRHRRLHGCGEDRPETDAYRDFRIWMDVDPELSVRRGAERDQDWAGSDAEAIHRGNRHLVAERLCLHDVDPLPRMDVIVDNTDFARPRLIQG